MRPRHVALLAIVSALLLGIPGLAGSPDEALAAPGYDCQKRDAKGECTTEVPIVIPGDPGEPGRDPEPSGQPVRSGGPPAPTGHPLCQWVSIPATSTLRTMYPEAPPDAVFQVLDCGAFDIRAGIATRWVPPGAPAAPVPPAPGVVAQVIFARVRVQMVAPELASDPPLGVASVVNTPVFVEVTNWQPAITDSECVLGVCVTLTATPTLTVDPGDGSASMPCDPPGSRYQPGGAPLADQAVGACAHTYLMRTGVEGRPTAWPGSVSVTWDVTWAGAGASGSFGPLVFTTPFERSVEEVSAVVVDGST